MPLLGKKPIGTIAYLGGVMTVPEAFCRSWGQMIEYNADYLVEPNERICYHRATVSYHAFARNTIVEGMLGKWLLMLDTDISFDPDLAARMLHSLDKHGIDVLTAVYQYKSPPFSPVLYRSSDDGKGYEMIGDWDKEAEIFEVGSSGAGALLVRKSVYDRIRRETGEGPFDIIPPFSEDHSFFKRLQKLGVKAYCNPNIEVHHLRVQPLSLKDYDREAVRLGDRKEVGGFK